jgi:outer membrane lipoprotein-sorting protein
MAFALPAHAEPLDDLMQRLAQVKTARGKFVERKQLAMLETPLESSGTLHYVAPGRLEKHMLQPRRESMILDGDTLTLENRDSGQRRTFAVQENPVLWGFVESIRSTLSGDLATLRRFYDVRMEGASAGWHLRLLPTDRRMQKAAKEIRVSGSGSWVSSIEIVEAGGDHSVMTISREAP